MSITVSEIETIYEGFFEVIYKFFYYRTLSKEIAEDLTSETFIQFVKGLKEGKEIENHRAYLFGIAKIIFTNYLRQKYKDSIPFSQISEDFEDYLVDTVKERDNAPSNEDLLIKFLDRVPPAQREVLKLRFLEKNTLSEICTILKKNMNYVKTTQKRGLKSLRQLIEMDTPDPDEE
jgi:RNA polymerase sigma-70 factor (ECF subfamily)